mgnify:CR=1 FL=1
MGTCEVADVDLLSVSPIFYDFEKVNEECMYTYIRREARIRNDLIRPIEKTIEDIARVIDLLQNTDRLDWRPEDQSREQDGDCVRR